MKVYQIKIDFNVTDSIKRYVYVYLIEARKCYLIDSGVYGSQNFILEQLHKISRDISDVEGIFLTHAHPDHIGTAAWFKERTGCKIYASAGEKKWIENIDQQYAKRPIPNFYKLAGRSTPVDVIVKDGDVILLEDTLEMNVIGTPGHSCDEVSYMIDETVFIGDSIPVKGDIPIYVNKEDLLTSMEKLRNLKGISSFYPAWDRSYTKSELDRKVLEGIEIVESIDQAVKELSGMKEQKELTRQVCEHLKMPWLMQNPLFARTIQGHQKCGLSKKEQETIKC